MAQRLLELTDDFSIRVFSECSQMIYWALDVHHLKKMNHFLHIFVCSDLASVASDWGMPLMRMPSYSFWDTFPFLGVDFFASSATCFCCTSDLILIIAYLSSLMPSSIVCIF